MRTTSVFPNGEASAVAVHVARRLVAAAGFPARADERLNAGKSEAGIDQRDNKGARAQSQALGIAAVVRDIQERG